MAVIKPFKALRPAPESASIVASVPYDVVDRNEAKEFAQGNPLSFLRVTRSEIEFDDSVNPYSKEIYQRAKENLDKMVKEGAEKKDLRMYLDHGEDGIEEGQLMFVELTLKGYQLGKELDYHYAPGAEHTESAWADRLERPLLFLFGR